MASVCHIANSHTPHHDVVLQRGRLHDVDCIWFDYSVDTGGRAGAMCAHSATIHTNLLASYAFAKVLIFF
jgi:hypothetical protein